MVVRRDKYRIFHVENLGTCQCGKKNYKSRKEAKNEGKRVEREEGRQRERGLVEGYRCKSGGRFFHWGHSRERDFLAAEENRKSQTGLVAMVATAPSHSPTKDETMTSVLNDPQSVFSTSTSETPSPSALAAALSSITPEVPEQAAVPIPEQYTGITAQMEFVTPELAAEWLQQNTNNRALRTLAVDAHSRTLAKDAWRVNGETIKFTKSGILVDGQHRLEGAVDSGVGFWTFVVRGLEEDAADTVDIGMKRNLGDVLKRAGYERGSLLAAIATFALQVTNGQHFKSTDAERRALIENDPKLVWIVNEVVDYLPHRMASKTLFGYAYRVFHEIDEQAAADFFSALNNPADLPEGSPIKALARRLSSVDRASASWGNRIYILTLIYMTWNKWRRGEYDVEIIKPRRTAEGKFVPPKPI